MATIILQYQGVCELGPWHGQQLNAERSIVRPMARPSEKAKGAYRWRDGAWIWRPFQSVDEQSKEPVK
jgi:hypothetical protein